MNSSIDTAIDVLQTEKSGIDALLAEFAAGASPIAENFRKAVDLLIGIRGRVIVTGMGKSGHVARKIAATMASTGTRASYVHPGEASHGDLGMISDDDVVLALSNSGETTELGDVLGYAGRFSIPVIAMTSGADSTLARAGDAVLLLPKMPEACQVTRAPTTSTTMMMALGDALAVAVLRQKGFTANDFHTFHPGGKLGAALKRVTDLMHHTDMPLCSPDDQVSVAVEVITKGGFGCVGVVDAGGKLVGIVTDGDLRRHFSRALSNERVGDIMSPRPFVVAPDSLAAEALALLSQHRITAVFIVNAERQPVGLLHVHDCLSVGVV